MSFFFYAIFEMHNHCIGSDYLVMLIGFFLKLVSVHMYIYMYQFSIVCSPEQRQRKNETDRSRHRDSQRTSLMGHEACGVLCETVMLALSSHVYGV